MDASSPTRHCQIAECSESIGRSHASGVASGDEGSCAATSAARARASGMTRWPPATSVSLFAVATTLPASSAARTGRRLTTPPVATMTRSTSSRTAIRTIASGASMSVAPPRSRERRSARASASASATTAGRRVCAWRASVAPSRPAARATMRKASGPAASMTSTAWVPIDPVEPRSATPTGPRSPAPGVEPISRRG